MAYNGTGTFTRLYSWEDDRDAGVKIRADRMDDEDDGFATGLTTAVTKDGQTTPTANLPMGGFKHTGVADGTAANHYAAVGQLQNNLAGWADAGGTADAITATFTPTVTALTNGMMLGVRAAAANATTTPTFQADATTARTIVKEGGAALVAGDIAADGHELLLRYDLANTRWELLNPKPSSAELVNDTTPQLGGPLDTNSHQVRWSKGADIASPAGGALTLGTDGNYFDITGTNAITSIVTVGVGTVIKLHFDGALTLTHHSTDLIMPNAENVVTVAGDEFEFIEYASGDWRCAHQPQRLASTTFKGLVEKATQAEAQALTADKYPDASLVGYNPAVPKLVVRLIALATTPAASFLYNLLGSLSVTDGGTGVYTLNWTNTLNTPRVSAVLVSASSLGGFVEIGTPGGTSVVVRAFTSAGAAVDPTSIDVVVWGNLA